MRHQKALCVPNCVYKLQTDKISTPMRPLFTCLIASAPTLTNPSPPTKQPTTGRTRAVVAHAAGVLPPGLGPRHGAPLLHAGGTQAERERRVGRALARRQQATVIFRPQRPMHREMLCARGAALFSLMHPPPLSLVAHALGTEGGTRAFGVDRRVPALAFLNPAPQRSLRRAAGVAGAFY